MDTKKNASAFQLPLILEKNLQREKGECAFVIVGDVAQSLPLLHNYLHKFKHINVPKFFTAGNHDIWVESEGANSFLKYTLLLKEAVEDAGFHFLDAAPKIMGDIGFVGNIGWYDYSFRRRYLILPDAFKLIRVKEKNLIDWQDLTIEDYRKKVLFGEIDGKLHMITRWNDIMFIRWEMTDEEFVDYCLGKIKQDFDEIREKVSKIVFFSHHIHFQQCVQYMGVPKWDFNTAFYGSEKIGQFLLKEKKLKTVIFAHSHIMDARKVQHVNAYNFPFDRSFPVLHSISI